MNRAHKTLHILSWIPCYLLLSFPLVMVTPFIAAWPWWSMFAPLGLIPLGLVIVPISLAWFDWRGSWPRIFWLWDNNHDETSPDWIPPWWYKAAADGAKGKVAQWFPRFWYLAIRNPVGNLRMLLEDRPAAIESNWDMSKPMEARQMIAARAPVAWAWKWAGPFAGYRCVWLHGYRVSSDGAGVMAESYTELWVGWKVGELGLPGLDITLQFRHKRAIGT